MMPPKLAIVTLLSMTLFINPFLPGDGGGCQPIPPPDPCPELKTTPESPIGPWSFAAPVLEWFGSALLDGAKSWIGDNTVGRILDMLFGIGGNKETQEILDKLKDMDAKLDQIKQQLTDISNQIVQLSNQLSLSTTILEQYIASVNIGAAITAINTHYDSYGKDGLMQFKGKTPKTVNKNDVKAFASAVVYNWEINKQINAIHDGICPQNAGIMGIMELCATRLAKEYRASGRWDAESVMAYYGLFESYFSKLLTIQYKGAALVCEANNQMDPKGTTSLNWLNYNFNPAIEEEIAAFQRALMKFTIRIMNNRKVDFWGNDIGQGWGLINDGVLTPILHRAWFYYAVMKKDYQHSLWGIVVAPKEYAKKSTLDVQVYPNAFLTREPNWIISGVDSEDSDDDKATYPLWSLDGNKIPHLNVGSTWCVWTYRFDGYTDNTTCFKRSANVRGGDLPRDFSVEFKQLPYTRDYKPKTGGPMVFGLFFGQWRWGLWPGWQNLPPAVARTHESREDGGPDEVTAFPTENTRGPFTSLFITTKDHPHNFWDYGKTTEVYMRFVYDGPSSNPNARPNVFYFIGPSAWVKGVHHQRVSFHVDWKDETSGEKALSFYAIDRQDLDNKGQILPLKWDGGAGWRENPMAIKLITGHEYRIYYRVDINPDHGSYSQVVETYTNLDLGTGLATPIYIRP